MIMLSLKNLVCINGTCSCIFFLNYSIWNDHISHTSGLILICLLVHIQRAASTPVSDEQFIMDKRRTDGHGRTPIPLFRGSNLGIFVRKRPFALLPEHSMRRRKETRTLSVGDENLLAEYLFNEDNQRRSDDYSENPGPIFGR